MWQTIQRNHICRTRHVHPESNSCNKSCTLGFIFIPTLFGLNPSIFSFFSPSFPDCGLWRTSWIFHDFKLELQITLRIDLEIITNSWRNVFSLNPIKLIIKRKSKFKVSSDDHDFDNSQVQSSYEIWIIFRAWRDSGREWVLGVLRKCLIHCHPCDYISWAVSSISLFVLWLGLNEQTL